MKNQRIFGVMLILVLGGCAADVAATGEQPTDKTASMMASERQEGADAYDPFAGDMPDLLVDAHARVLGGEQLDLGTMKALWDYAQREPHDARPWLILARDSMALESPGFAVSQYRAAFDADAACADYAPMLPDVLSVAMNYGGFEYDTSVALLVDAWGERALPAIDAVMLAMHDEGNLEGARKLAAIREEVVGN